MAYLQHHRGTANCHVGSGRDNTMQHRNNANEHLQEVPASIADLPVAYLPSRSTARACCTVGWAGRSGATEDGSGTTCRNPRRSHTRLALVSGLIQRGRAYAASISRNCPSLSHSYSTAGKRGRGSTWAGSNRDRQQERMPEHDAGTVALAVGAPCALAWGERGR